MKTKFNIIEAIKERTSVRTFEPRPLDEVTLGEIQQFIASLDNPFKIKGIEIPVINRSSAEKEKLGTYGVIQGASTYICLVTPTDTDALLMAAYEFETLVLYLTSLGLGTVWLGGTLKRKNFTSALNIDDERGIPVVSPVGYPAPRRFAEKIMRKTLSGDKRKPWEDLFFNENFSTPLSRHDAGSYEVVLDMVRLAPSATNKQPWRIVKIADDFLLFGKFKPQPGKIDTTMRYMDMGIAMCHFALSAAELGLKGSFSQDAVNPADYPADLTYIATWHCD